MKYIKLVILIIVIMLTAGCWNYRELSELGIVTAIGIDVIDNEYLVSIDVVNTKKAASSSQSSSASNEAPTTVYQARGKTIKDAVNSAMFEAPFQPYVGHINLLAIGEEAAKKGIYNFIDYFMADTEIRKIFPVVVVEGGKAVDALKVILPLETDSAKHIHTSLESESEVGGFLSNRKFDEIINCLFMQGRHPTISSVKIFGSPETGSNVDNTSFSIPPTTIKITGVAVLINDKLVGYLHGADSLGYTIIRHAAKTIEINFPCDDKGNYGSVTIDGIKSGLKLTLKDDKPSYEISVTGEAALPEYNCKIDLKNPTSSIAKIEKMVDKELTKVLDGTITKLQKELKSDVLGFGERLYKEQYKYWEKVKNDWNNIFPNTKYKAKVNITIKSLASTNKPAKEVQKWR